MERQRPEQKSSGAVDEKRSWDESFLPDAHGQPTGRQPAQWRGALSQQWQWTKGAGAPAREEFPDFEVQKDF